ncbi:MAG: hypothetical protein IIC32_06170 [Chloroflexi bacterium]|nr:hypothetical protein [Chloroflexota bacterium]
MTAVRRNTSTVLLTALAVLLVLTATGRGDAPSELRRLAGPYAQDLVRWELTHALDKWVHLASVVLLRRSIDEDGRRAEVAEFFDFVATYSHRPSSVGKGVAPKSPTQLLFGWFLGVSDMPFYFCTQPSNPRLFELRPSMTVLVLFDPTPCTSGSPRRLVTPALLRIASPNEVLPQPACPTIAMLRMSPT